MRSINLNKMLNEFLYKYGFENVSLDYTQKLIMQMCALSIKISYVFILVPTMENAFHSRHTIRETWAANLVNF